MAAPIPERKQRKVPLGERAKQLTAELAAARAKGGMKRALEHLTGKVPEGASDLEEAMLEIRGIAAARERAAERKVDAINNPEQRFQTKVGSRLETNPNKTVCEDSIIADESSELYAILDGMGGHGDGATASALAREAVARLLTGKSTDVNQTIQKMREALTEADRAVKEYNTTNLKNSGTTATVAKIVKEPSGKRTAVVGHVGDSRLYIRKKNGRLVQITTDHNSLDALVNSGSISEAERQILRTKFAEVVDINTLDDTDQRYEFKNSDGRVIQRNTERELYDDLNSITKAVGFGDSADVFSAELEDGDQLLLASDGLHDLVTDSRINEAFADGSNPDTVAGRLLADSKKPIRPGSGGKVDDDRGIIVVGREDVLEPIIEAVKVDYVNRALSRQPLPVPYDPVGQEAFRAALLVDAAALEEAFKAYYGTHGFADSTEVRAWSAIGAEVTDWIKDLGTEAAPVADPAAAAGPTPGTPEPVPTDPVEAARLLEENLQLLRGLFTNRTERLPVINQSVLEALRKLKAEAFGGNQSDTFKIWLRNGVRRERDGQLTASLLEAAGFTEVAGAHGTEREAYQQGQLDLDINLFDRSLLRQVAVERLVRSSVLDASALGTLDYLDQERIKGDPEVVAKLAQLLEHLHKTADELKALPETAELAKKLGMTRNHICEVVIAQREALLQQAAQQEKAGRSWKAALAKAGGYLAAGLGGGLLVAAAAANPLLLTGAIAGAKTVDTILTHTKRNKNRERIEAELFKALQTERAAFVGLAAAEQTLDKSSGLLRLTLENLAGGLAAQKDRTLAITNNQVSNGEFIFTELVRRNCDRELVDYERAKAEYDDAIANNDPATIQTQLYHELLRTQAVYEQAAEPYRRAAVAQEAISGIEYELEQRAEQSDQNKTFEQIAAVLGIKGELLSEKLSSTVFFAAAGAAAREWVPVRVALSAFAGARLGDMVASLVSRRLDARNETKRNEQLLSASMLDAVNITKPQEAFDRLILLTENAARTRERLNDTAFRTRQPAEHRRLEQLVQRYEALKTWAKAQHALDDFVAHEKAAYAQVMKVEWRRMVTKYFLRALPMMAGGVLGAFVGFELAELAAAKLEASQQPAAPTAEPVVQPSVNAITPDNTAPEPVASGSEPAAEVPPVAAAPSTPEPATPGSPEHAPGTATSGTPGASTPEPTPAPAASGSATDLSHKVGKGEGLSHALRGQDTMKTINAELRDTKVTLNGHEVSLNETGVRNAGEVSAVLQDNGSGEKTIVLFDANDGHQITAGEMDKYLYVLKDGLRGISAEASAHVDGSNSVGEGEIPSGGFSGDDTEPTSVADIFREPLPTDTADSYIQAGLEAYVTKHPEWSHLPTADLQSRPELSAISAQLKGEYLEHLGAPAADRAVGGGAGIPFDPHAVEAAERTAMTGLVNTETGRLTEAGVRELGLNEHISGTGEIQDYSSFKKEIMTLLQADERDRITGPNGLIFEDRGGVLYVDVAGGAVERFPLDEKLYQELMAEYKGHVESKLDGRFDKESFYDAMDRADTHHEFKTFEQADLTLNSLNEAKNFSSFKQEILHVMTIHDTDKFRTANGLTFIKEGDQLFVRATISRYELTPALYEALMQHYERLLRSPDFKGVFDGEQLAKAFENSK